MMGLSKNVHYGKKEYWDKRYIELLTDPFDWYQTYDRLKDIITQYITPGSRILHVGCGNSTLGYEMFQDGFKHICNIDISLILIDDLCTKYHGTLALDPKLFEIRHMDVMNMAEIEDGSFDLVLDKGLLDSVLCGTYSTQNCKKMFKEVSRVLKSKGYYMCVSYGDPNIRLNYFDNPDYEWGLIAPSPHKVFKPNVDQKEVEFSEDKEKNKDLYHYIYVFQKHVQIHSPVSQQRRLSGKHGS